MAIEKFMGGETEFGVQIEVPEYRVLRDNIQLSHFVVSSLPVRLGLANTYDDAVRGNIAQTWGEQPASFDSRYEQPLNDIRGRSFRAQEQKLDATEYETTGGVSRKTLDLTDLLSYIIRQNRQRGGTSDRFLRTGDRWYVDHNHPELSFPEVRSARDAVRYQKAAELRVNIARINAEKLLRTLSCEDVSLANARIRVYGHNQDFGGHTFGTHENYLVDRGADPHYLIRSVMPFFVARIAFVGLGTLGSNLHSNKFQLSQRAMFTVNEVGVQTTFDRPIVNTRDEPHAQENKYMRHHVISGDANHAEWALYLKFGTTALLLKMIEDHAIDDTKYAIAYPANAMYRWSYDWRMQTKAHMLHGGKQYTAPELLSLYVDDMQTYTARVGATDEEKDVLEKFAFIVQKLLHFQNQPHSQDSTPELFDLDQYIDWAMHFRLIDEYIGKSGIAGYDARLKNISLMYCDIDPQKSLFHILQRKGKIARIVSEDDILDAFNNPPSNTRAYLRGKVIERYPDELERINWEGFRMLEQDILLNPASGTKTSVDHALACDTAKEFLTAMNNL